MIYAKITKEGSYDVWFIDNYSLTFYFEGYEKFTVCRAEGSVSEKVRDYVGFFESEDHPYEMVLFEEKDVPPYVRHLFDIAIKMRDGKLDEIK